jgi:hypothetical protein
VDGLQIDELWDLGVGEDVMAAADAPQFEAKCLGQAAQIIEGHVGHRPARQADKELALIHASTVVIAWDGTLARQAPACARELQTVNQLDGYRVEIIEQA